jgi:hypothetical protein
VKLSPHVTQEDSMAGKTAKYREETWPVAEGEHAVSELVAEHVGSQSPFGDEQQFPLPIERLTYVHPTAAERPNHAPRR